MVFIGGLAIVALSPRDPIFHGKPESQWITNIVYGMSLSEDQNKEQVQRWRDFGPAGLRVLERGLDVNRGGKYRKFYSRLTRILPNSVMRLLPAPQRQADQGARQCVLDLLRRMGEDAHPAWTAVARALADENRSVRQLAITYFTHPENDKAFLNQMPARDKEKLLPLFIRALEDNHPAQSGLRNNAALALKYYPEHALLVTPALLKALQDPSPNVRLRCAEALNRVDPVAGSKAGAVTVVAQLLSNPDYQVSGQAAYALRQFQHDADLAVTALIEALHGTNRAVVGASAVWSLQWAFPSHTNRTIPELRKAGELKDNAGGYARSAVQFLEANPIIKRQ